MRDRQRTEKGIFTKTAAASAFDMFDAEAEGLRELAASKTIRVPEVVACAIDGDEAFISLEWIDFEPTSASTEQMLGEQLAALHRCTADQFGWHRDNTIGLTPQHNSQTGDWIRFFREQRLEYQLNLAASNGFDGELQTLGKQLLENLDAFFVEYEPAPSLLHGDLWGGNWGATNGQPIIFDPAVHYGDRECDIAMTKLFGGYGRTFYEAYQSAWPLADGHEARLKLYQLYHVLNHVNLFGVSYLARAIQLMRSL